MLIEKFVKIKLNLEYAIDDNVEEAMLICYNYQNINYRKEKKSCFIIVILFILMEENIRMH